MAQNAARELGGVVTFQLTFSSSKLTQGQRRKWARAAENSAQLGRLHRDLNSHPVNCLKSSQSEHRRIDAF